MQPETGRPSESHGDPILPPATTQWRPLADTPEQTARPLAPFLPSRGIRPQAEPEARAQTPSPFLREPESAEGGLSESVELSEVPGVAGAGGPVEAPFATGDYLVPEPDSRADPAAGPEQAGAPAVEPPPEPFPDFPGDADTGSGPDMMPWEEVPGAGLTDAAQESEAPAVPAETAGLDDAPGWFEWSPETAIGFGTEPDLAALEADAAEVDVPELKDGWQQVEEPAAFPLDAFIVPEDARPQPTSARGSHTGDMELAQVLAGRLEEMAERLRRSGLAALLPEGDAPADALLAALISGYLAGRER